MLGDQKVRPLYCRGCRRAAASWCLARASSPMAAATWSSSAVARWRPCRWPAGTRSPARARATPCRHSFHQLYAGTPSRGMAGAPCSICAIFSRRVICATRSAACCAKDGRLSPSRGVDSDMFMGNSLSSSQRGRRCHDHPPRPDPRQPVRGGKTAERGRAGRQPGRIFLSTLGG